MAPENPLAAEEFEKVRATGSNIPMFDVELGANTTFPVGKRQPPLKEPEIWTFEEVPRFGLMTRMFEVKGTPMTLPFGARTRPLKPLVPTTIFEDPRPTGSNWMTLAVPGDGTRTFPEGKRQAPCWAPPPLAKGSARMFDSDPPVKFMTFEGVPWGANMTPFDVRTPEYEPVGSEATTE